MSLDGVWSTEILGMFGWEATGIIVFDNGRVIGGGNNHYEFGTYEQNDKEIRVHLSVNFHGTPRTIFGSSDRNLSVEAVLKPGEKIMEGTVFRADKPKNTVLYKLTRQADLPD